MRFKQIILGAILLIQVILCEKYYKVNFGERQGVSVFDDDNKALYGVVLPKDLSYEKFLIMKKMKRFETECDDQAVDKDIIKMNLQQHLKQVGAKLAGCKNLPNFVNFNGKYQKDYGYPTCLQISDVTYTNTDPKSNRVILAQQKFTNSFNDVITKQFNVSANYKEKIMQINNKISSYTKSQHFNIEKADQMIQNNQDFIHFNMNIDTNQTAINMDVHEEQFNNYQVIDIEPQQCKAVGIAANVLQYKINYSLNQKIYNFYGINYSNQCNGHHYYFISVNDLDQNLITSPIQGIIEANVNVQEEQYINDC